MLSIVATIIKAVLSKILQNYFNRICSALLKSWKGCLADLASKVFAPAILDKTRV